MCSIFKKRNIPTHGLPWWLRCKESACNAETWFDGLISRSARSSGEGNGYLLPCSCLENSMYWGVCGIKSMGSQRVEHNWETNTFTFSHHYTPPKSIIFRFYNSSKQDKMTTVKTNKQTNKNIPTFINNIYIVESG